MMTKTIICAVICFILGSSRYIFVCLSLELLDCIWNPIFVCLLCSVSLGLVVNTVHVIDWRDLSSKC